MTAKDSAVTADGRAAAREEKLRKTNTLLVAIAIIFTIWRVLDYKAINVRRGKI
jgi:hypothetical protein